MCAGKQGQVHRNKIAAAERDASLASRLTKEFLEENMHKYTQKVRCMLLLCCMEWLGDDLFHD